MKQKNSFIFSLSVLAGVSVWFYFLLALKIEPWDTPYGSFVMLILGFLFGLYAPKKPWLWPIGLYIGQFLFGTFAFLKSIFFSVGDVDLFFPAGMIYLVFFCTPALITSLLGSVIRKIASKFKEKS